MGIWCTVCLGDRDPFKRWQAWLELISEQNKLLRNWGGMCWHRFLKRVKEGDFYEGKVADLKETKRCTGLESADESPSDEPEEYAVKMLIHPFW